EDRDATREGELERGIAFHLLGLRYVEQVGDVDLAALEHRHARRGLGHALEDHALHRGWLAPVPLERFHDQLDTGRVADELVRPEADGMFLEALVADFLHVLLGHDPGGTGHEAAVEGHEVWPRLVEMETNAVGADDLDVPDF